MNLYGVVFKDNGKIYYFKSGLELKINDYVIVETERGIQFAKISTIPEDVVLETEIKEVVRIACEEDYEEHLKNLKEAEKALKKAIQFANDLDLKMRLTSAEFTFDRKQLLFQFTADDRIDFRDLAKKLASIYHTRIELRQIGARDKAKEIGGLGVCGRQLCCNNFLREMESVSMNMAKNQNLALTPNKINGLCGRLLCCLTYEDENYLECSKGMPSVGNEINTKKGRGKVTSVDILNRKYKVLINGEKEEFYLDDNSKK